MNSSSQLFARTIVSIEKAKSESMVKYRLYPASSAM